MDEISPNKLKWEVSLAIAPGSFSSRNKTIENSEPEYYPCRCSWRWCVPIAINIQLLRGTGESGVFVWSCSLRTHMFNIFEEISLIPNSAQMGIFEIIGKF